MRWCRRGILALPFLVAASLNVLVCFADNLHLRIEHFAGLGFLFAAPWGWLLEHDWYFGHHPAQWVDNVVSYVAVLWIPALLYALSLWLLIRGLGWAIIRWARPRTASLA